MSAADLPTRMRADLKVAMRGRDQASVRALRSTLAAFANAEAPPLDGGGPAPTIGLVDHARLELTPADWQRLLQGEIDERAAAVVEYEAGGQGAAADDLRAELAVLEGYLTPATCPPSPALP